MTSPGSAKGQEREARPQSVTELRDEMAREISRADGGASSIEPCGDATYEQMADAALFVVAPELERLTFERDAAQATADNVAQQLEDLRDDVLGDESLHVLEVASAAGREVERLTAEVALTRQALKAEDNQLTQFRALEVRQQRDRSMSIAGQRAMELGQIRGVLVEADPKAELPGYDYVKTVDVARAIVGQRDEARMALEYATTSYEKAVEERDRLREALAKQQALVAAVALPEDWESQLRRRVHAFTRQIAKAQEKNPNTIAERNGWVYNAESCADDIAGDVAVMISGWAEGARSATSEAAPAQHEVRMHPSADRFHAKCRTCGEFRCGEQAEAEDWKDQHEADTLRPQAFADYDLTDVKPATGFFVEKASEGLRPSGSEAETRPSNLAVWTDDDEREFDVKILDIQKVATIQLDHGEIKEVLLHELQPRQDAARAARSEVTQEPLAVAATEAEPSTAPREERDELRELATFAYECGLVGSVGDRDHADTLRAAVAAGRQAKADLSFVSLPIQGCGRLDWCDNCNRHVPHGKPARQAGVDAFSVCTCNAEDETRCTRCGQCSRCHGLCDCEIHPGTRCADCEADEGHCSCDDGFNPTSTGGDE